MNIFILLIIIITFGCIFLKCSNKPGYKDRFATLPCPGKDNRLQCAVPPKCYGIPESGCNDSSSTPNECLNNCENCEKSSGTVCGYFCRVNCHNKFNTPLPYDPLLSSCKCTEQICRECNQQGKRCYCSGSGDQYFCGC